VIHLRSAKEMKSILTLLCIFSITACATAIRKKKSFQSVDEFLTWADVQLEKENEENLIAIQTSESVSKESKLQGIEVMKRRLSGRTLSEVFEGERFPENEDTFKLSGHDGKLPHVHIDFKKEEEWFLQSITICR
jgi:hypothetical protein